MYLCGCVLRLLCAIDEESFRLVQHRSVKPVILGFNPTHLHADQRACRCVLMVQRSHHATVLV